MKKKFVIFSVLVAMLFAVCIVSASAATSSGDQRRLVSAGLPLDLLFVLPNGETGYVSQVNTWISNGGPAYNYNTTQDGFNPTIVFTDDTQTPSATDVQIRDFGNAIPATMTMSTPFNPWNMTTQQFNNLVTNVGMGINGPVTDVFSFKVTRVYNVRLPAQNASGDLVWYNVGRSFTQTYSGNVTANTVSWIQFPSMVRSEVNAIKTDLVNEGYEIDQAVVVSVSSGIDGIPAGRATNIYFNHPEYVDPLLSDLRRIASDSLGSLYNVSISYDRLDWTGWLTNAVGGFMSFELVPGLPIYGILSALLGIPLLIWFLRLFAGG